MSGEKQNNIVIGIYFHPEAYPPTLNAIGELSECFDGITVIHRPHLKGTWKYPANVKAVPSGAYISSVGQEKAPLQKKILFFFQFTMSLLKACRTEKPDFILVYDSLSLLAYSLIKPLLSKHTSWYHNHDVTEQKNIRKYSISWLAGKNEIKAFKNLDIFSLPANERLPYFPMDAFKGKYFFIPNYPAKKFYGPFYKHKEPSTPIRIIFQGSIGPYHGIEEIIPLLKETIDQYPLELVLKGPCRADYRQLCLELAEKHQVSNKVLFLEVTPYAEVAVVSSTCHIGIGILAQQDLMNTTLGTASNKLYEYAAVGLPVIYYNSLNFTKYLNKFIWAVPTEVTSMDIKEKISFILKNYNELSGSAHIDFIRELNFENGFMPVKSYINNVIVKLPK